jgi:hypothetical protein
MIFFEKFCVRDKFSHSRSGYNFSISIIAENRTDSSGSLDPMNPSLECFFTISTTCFRTWILLMHVPSSQRYSSHPAGYSENS